MVSIIVAVAENGTIGDRNALLWHISEDLKRFKALTTGHPVIMGRKTYESLGRPLPNRTNVVLSRSGGEFPGCRVARSTRRWPSFPTTRSSSSSAAPRFTSRPCRWPTAST